MKASGTNLSMIRGDDETITVTLSGYTLGEGDVITFGVKKDVEDTAYLIHKQITEFTDNAAVINIDHADTRNLAFMDYFYDIQIKFASGKIRTLIKASRFTINEEVVTDG